MKKISFIIVVIFIFSSCARAAWVDADGVGQGNINVSQTTTGSSWIYMAIDGSNNPHIIWREYTATTFDAYYVHWNGSAWVDVTGVGTANINVSLNGGVSTGPSVHFNSSGVPFVGWGDCYSAQQGMYVKKWTGSGWVGMDGTAAGAVAYSGCALGGGQFALDPLTDYPDAIWDGVNYIKWTGTVWTAPTIPVSSTAAFIKIDATGKKHILYMNGGSLYYAGYNGSAWVGANGGSLSSDYFVTSGVLDWSDRLEINPAGIPVVTYVSSGGDAYCLKWNGSAWADMTGSGLAFANISNDGLAGYGCDLDLDASGNPYVAWDDNTSGNSDIYVLKWNGSAWVDMTGIGQASRCVLNTTGVSSGQNVRVSADGVVHVAWCENVSGNDEVYYLKFKQTIATPTPTPTSAPILTPTPTRTPLPSGDIHIYPNPFCRDTAVGKTLKIENLPAGARVLFYSLTGEIVDQYSVETGVLYWKGWNMERQFVSPGIYYYLIADDKGREIMKGKLYIMNK